MSRQGLCFSSFDELSISVVSHSCWGISEKTSALIKVRLNTLFIVLWASYAKIFILKLQFIPREGNITGNQHLLFLFFELSFAQSSNQPEDEHMGESQRSSNQNALRHDMCGMNVFAVLFSVLILLLPICLPKLTLAFNFG